jgi:hypothetical protein
MIYRLFGWWWRWQACKMAAAVHAGCGEDEGLCPKLWSTTVYFEQYMTEGATNTAEDFGPKEPVELAVVSK